MTSPKPSPEIIRTERAFQVYLSLINTCFYLSHDRPFDEESVLTQLKIYNTISYLAADIFVNVEFMQASDLYAVYGNLANDVEED